MKIITVQTTIFISKNGQYLRTHINGGLKMPYKIQVRKIAIITVQISRLAKRISVLTEAMVRIRLEDVITLKIVRKTHLHN